MRRAPFGGGFDIEIRQVFEAADFGVSTRIKGDHSHQCEGNRVESGFESLIGGDAVETLYQTLHLPTFWLAFSDRAR